MMNVRKDSKGGLSPEKYREMTVRATYIMAPCGYVGRDEPCKDCPVRSCKYNFGDWLSQIESSSRMVNKYIVKAEEMLIEGNHEGATKLLNKFPDNEAALCGMGTAAFIGGDNEAALSYFKKVTKIHPEYYGGWNGLGVMELIDGDIASSIEVFTSGIKGTSDPGILKCNLAFVNILKGNTKEAEKDFQYLINNTEDKEILSMALYGKGLILSMLKDRDEARNMFVKALEFSPGDELIESAIRTLG